MHFSGLSFLKLQILLLREKFELVLQYTRLQYLLYHSFTVTMVCYGARVASKKIWVGHFASNFRSGKVTFNLHLSITFLT